MTTAAELEDLVHDHVFLGAAHDDHARRTMWVVALTALMMIAEIVAGYWTGSMALLADGFHMATHAGALGVSAAAYAYARKHARSSKFSFGTGKVGDLAGFASALVLGVVAVGIGVESVKRLLEPTTVAFGERENFLQNFLRLLGEPGRVAEVHFLEPVASSEDGRRRMAETCRDRIVAAMAG